MAVGNHTAMPSPSKSVSFAIDGQVYPVSIMGQESTLKDNQVKHNAVMPYEEEEEEEFDLDDELFSNLKLRSRVR